MTTATRTRTMRLTQTPGGPALVVTEAAPNGAVTRSAYYLSAASDGATRFAKDDGTEYLTTDHSCSCPGHRRHGHRGVTCKHRAARAVLVAQGRLPRLAAF